MNVVILSMPRCGVSWIGEVLSQLHERLFGIPLEITYEKDRAKVSRTLVKGITGVYNIDPTVLLNLGYDKIIIIKRELENLKKAQAHYHGYQEQYGTYENMVEARPGFFEKIELYYELLYEQENVLQNPRVLLVSLEDLNNYTYSCFKEIMDFLGFKLSLKNKIKFILRVLKDNIRPFIVATNPLERDWNIYSALLPKGHALCARLQFLEKIQEV